LNLLLAEGDEPPLYGWGLTPAAALDGQEFRETVVMILEATRNVQSKQAVLVSPTEKTHPMTLSPHAVEVYCNADF